MPFKYRYDAESNCLHARGTGKVTLQDFLDYHRTLKIKDAPPTLSILSDYRELDPSGLTTSDIKKIRMSALDKIEGTFRKVSEAVVVSNTLAYGLSRMYDALIYSEIYEINVFMDLGVAKAWLGLGPDTVLKCFQHNELAADFQRT
jgi:hypothetical protein